jgi:hypothetical protein
VLGKLSRKHEADSGLDLARGKGGLLVVSGELSGFSGNALKNVVDERVHDAHSLLGDTGIRVDLLEDLVDVRRVRFSSLLALLGASGGLLGGLGGLLGGSLGHLQNSDNKETNECGERQDLHGQQRKREVLMDRDGGKDKMKLTLGYVLF